MKQNRCPIRAIMLVIRPWDDFSRLYEYTQMLCLYTVQYEYNYLVAYFLIGTILIGNCNYLITADGDEKGLQNKHKLLGLVTAIDLLNYVAATNSAM